jgi:hypothetical protein
MRYIGFFLCLNLVGCSALMPVADELEKIVDDNAVKVEVSRETIQKETDLTISIQIVNKDKPKL